VAGLAMGMIIFIIASGLTLVFGLMDVLNFGHGVFIALGAFMATSVLGAMAGWTGSAELWRNLVAVLPAMLVAMAVAGALGWPSSASSCGRCTASTSSRSSSPWAA
jgi:branched-chain amino acid transport system permease protein